jgi:predicted DNA-binding protein
MKQAHRFFNLLIPFKTYEELKEISAKTERPIAEIVRQGIGLVLKKPSCTCEGAKNGK